MRLPLVVTFSPQILIALVMGVVSIIIFSEMHEKAITDSMRGSLEGSMLYAEERVAGPFEKQRTDTKLMAMSMMKHNASVYRGDGQPLQPPMATNDSLMELKGHLTDMWAMQNQSNGTYDYIYQQYRMWRVAGADPTSHAIEDYDWGWAGINYDYAYYQTSRDKAVSFSEAPHNHYLGYDTSVLTEFDQPPPTDSEFGILGRQLARWNASEGVYTAVSAWVDASTGKHSMLFSFHYPVIFDDATGFVAAIVGIDLNTATWLFDYTKSLNIPATHITILQPNRQLLLATSFNVEPFERPNVSDVNSYRMWNIYDVPEPRLQSALVEIQNLGHPIAELPYTTEIIAKKSNADIFTARPLRRSGLNLLVVGVTERSHFYSEGDSARRDAIILCSALLAAAVIVAILTAVQLSRPLTDLSDRMMNTASLGEDTERLNVSTIAEIAKMQDAYLAMKDELGRVKSFLPQGLMVHHGAESENVMRVNSTASSEPDEDLLSRSSISVGAIHAPVLLLDRLREEVNAFVTQDCVTLIVSFAYGVEIQSQEGQEILSMALDRVYVLADVCRGVVESCQPHQVVVSFGARVHIGNPVGHAIKMALQITEASINPSIECTVLLDRCSALVGSCGSVTRRNQLVYAQDIEALKALAVTVHNSIRVPVAATGRITASLTERTAAIPFHWLQWTNGELLGLYALCRVDKGHAESEDGLALRYLFAGIGNGDTNVKEMLTPSTHCSGEGEGATLYDTLVRQATAHVRTTIPETNESPACFFKGWDLGPKTRSSVVFPAFDSNLESSEHGGRAGNVLKRLHELESKETPKFPPDCGSGDQSSPIFALALAPSDTARGTVGSGISSAEGKVRSIRAWQRSEMGIGSGSFGCVYRALHTNGSLAAMKILPLMSQSVSLHDLRKELAIVSQQRHENLVGYVDAEVTEEEVVVVMELMAGGSLDNLVRDFGALPIRVVRRFAADSLRGISHLHRAGIVHCDIKPQNILVGVDGVCKVADFGSALHPSFSAASDNDDMKVHGTPIYMAPEVARGQPPTPASDMWSFGLVMHELVTGTLPFNQRQLATIKTTTGFLVIRMMGKLSSDCQDDEALEAPPIPRLSPAVEDHRAVTDFIASCLRVDPSQRPSAEDLMRMEFLI